MKHTTVLIVALFAFTLGTTHTATAQCPSERILNQSVQPQIEQNLADSEYRDGALMLALDLARRGCLAGDDQLIGSLVDIYEQNESNERQLLSILILGEIGDRASLMNVYRLSDDEESDTVRRVTLAVATSHQLIAVR